MNFSSNNDAVYTSYVSDNSELIANVANLYLSEGMAVADVTFGKGVFWRKVDLTKLDFRASDIIPRKINGIKVKKLDFTCLPYKDGELDVLVLDPPYCHNPGAMIVNANYKNAETTKGMYHKDILDLYVRGMREAHRTLKVGGTLWVKCKDEIESSYQRWSHIEIYEAAIDLGFFAKDLFVLTQVGRPVVQHAKQQHARKNHSYLWIFKKPTDREKKELKRLNIFKSLHNARTNRCGQEGSLFE